MPEPASGSGTSISGGPNASGPISYAVNGKQYVVGTGQGTMFVFSLPD